MRQSAERTRPEVSLIIVGFDSGSDLSGCLASVTADLAGVQWDGVIIENHPSGAACSLADSTPIRIIRNSTNVGFARAVNQGVAATHGVLVWLLNPDCVTTPGVFAALRDALESQPDCGVAGPRVVNPDGSLQGTARGDPTFLTGLFGRSTLLSRVFPTLGIVRKNVKLRLTATEQAAPIDVDWVSGACLLARRSALESVGGLDERYFLYWEDADVCRRIRQRGLVIRYVPTATVVHAQGSSTRRVPQLAIRAFHRSAYVYYTTHVVPQRWHPGRLLAAGLLGARCWWKSRTVQWSEP